MKKITQLALLSLVLLAGCEKEDKTTVDVNAVTLTTELSATTFVLQEANAGKEALTITYKPVVEANTPVKYQTVFSYGEKSTTKEVTTNKVTYTVAELNSIAQSLKLPVGVATDVKVKTTAIIGEKKVTKGVAESTISITAYQTVIRPSAWGVVGSATPNGWNKPDVPMWRADDGTLVAYVTLIDGEIKFRKDQDWKENLGGSLDNLTQGGSNIPVTAGTYKIILDINKKTCKMELYSWGIAGDAANGWDADKGTDVVFTYEGASNTWVAKNVALKGGKELKFRLNNKWDTNFGADSSDNPTSQLEGKIKDGGSNIKITTAGNYNVSFSFDENKKGTYKIEKL
nr:SusE domain-containing protein [uncultured Capnocytophaga sp.]